MSLKVEGKREAGFGRERCRTWGERRAEAMEDKNKEDAEYDQMQKENKGEKRWLGQMGSKRHRK